MAPRKRPTLEGMRNVSAFLSQPQTEESSPTTNLHIQKIQLPQKQPRRYFDPMKLAQLAQSIKEHGILEPLLVRPLAGGNYELVAGERRLKAAQEAGLTEVPVVSKTLSDQEALQVALMENLQREDLNPVEETEAVLELLAVTLETDRDEITSLLNRANHAKNRDQQLEDNVILQLEKIESVLATIGRLTAESFRTNRLPLLNLPEDVLEVLRRGQLEYTKARAIARVKDEAQRQALMKSAITQDLSLSQIKESIAKLRATKPETASLSPPLLKERVNKTLQLIKRSKALDDPKKVKKIERLLQELELLAED